MRPRTPISNRLDTLFPYPTRFRYGLDTPTRYTINGTARIAPPPPTSPNNKPTSEPESSPSKYCSGSSTVSDGLLQLLDRLRLDQPLVPLEHSVPIDPRQHLRFQDP